MFRTDASAVMALCEFHWFSKLLGKQRTTRLLLPDVGKPPFPTYYLLHGQSDDHTIWTRRTRIEHYVAHLPLIIVMPDGDRGFYTDNNQGPPYARHIAEELPAVIERFFPAKPSRSARCIGGLSMGGYGALRAALAHPDRYISANSHSGALEFARGALRSGIFPDEYELILGKRPKKTSHDLEELARHCKRSVRRPRLLIDCGTDDFLLEDNRAFAAALTRMKLPHIYREFPGAHDWNYWDQHVREAIAFHAAALRIKPI